MCGFVVYAMYMILSHESVAKVLKHYGDIDYLYIYDLMIWNQFDL